MTETPDSIQTQPTVRWLKIMVTALTVTIIVGFTTIVVLFVMRFRDLAVASPLSLPETIELPGDSEAVAFTQGKSWFAVVTEDDEILIFDRSGGDIIRRIRISEH